jgi:hypothetical protein
MQRFQGEQRFRCSPHYRCSTMYSESESQHAEHALLGTKTEYPNVCYGEIYITVSNWCTSTYVSTRCNFLCCVSRKWGKFACTVVKICIKNSVAWVRERTIPTERPPIVGEVSANSWIEGATWCDGFLRSYSRLSRPEPLFFSFK